MTERYICIHGHFYQPPRENPWLEGVELQDSAYPYHDWNERVTAECYAPNRAARILDSEKRITDIVNNYSKMSFNFGPTLLCWMEKHQPEVYQAILEADRLSMEKFSGHGSALAQVYNHMIMPLASRRDKLTQVLWGIKDFEKRFKRFPEGMWLPETAADTETLEVLVEAGIKFTVLAPGQAKRVKRIRKGAKWHEMGGERIDPTTSYLCVLPSRKTIPLFFYDGPISRDIAFGGLLNNGSAFAQRLLSGFSDQRDWPQMVHIATDGETYGHHRRFGDMALAYCLHFIESQRLAKITNYGEYLEKHTPTHQVEIFDGSSWSCVHGIERWKDDCGCNSGMHPEWSQSWRKPLREAMDWLRDTLAPLHEDQSRELLKDPWKARDDYIDVILDRRVERGEAFFRTHSVKELSREEKVRALKLLEMQRNTMLMYTSCGWFFDEISGIETVQVMQYADRAVQLAGEVFGVDLEPAFFQKLSNAKSNFPNRRDGSQIYESFVKPGRLDLKKAGVHYAVSSLFEDYPEEINIYCYEIQKEDFKRIEAGKMEVAVGRVHVFSRITWESDRVSFCILHLGGHDFNGGVRSYLGEEAYGVMKEEVLTSFEKGTFADVVRLMDRHFGMHYYSLKDLFKDEQRKILDLLIQSTLDDFESAYRQMYENHRILMSFLQEAGFPIPKPFLMAAEFTLNLDMQSVLKGTLDIDRMKTIKDEIQKWNVSMDVANFELTLRRQIEKQMKRFLGQPSDLAILEGIEGLLAIAISLPFELNFWNIQNIYYTMGKTIYPNVMEKARKGDGPASEWINRFRALGEQLSFNLESILPKG